MTTIEKKKSDWQFWLGVSFLALLVVFAIFGPWFRHDFLAALGKPMEPPSSKFWLGTDEQGRDIFARLAYGARMSLLVGISVQVFSLVLGTTIGMLGVFAPRWISVPLLRFTDGMFAFPDILLAFLIIGVWGRGLVPVIVALSVTAWPSITRLVRAQVVSLKDRDYVVAARAQGASTLYVVLKHIMPHLWGIILAVSMVDVAGTILAESALSFLGIGIEAPYPSWGSMINDARLKMVSNPIMLVWPCFLLSATIFALNFVGDGLRASFDPRKK